MSLSERYWNWFEKDQQPGFIQGCLWVLNIVAINAIAMGVLYMLFGLGKSFH